MVYEIKSDRLTAKINTLGAELVSVKNTQGTEFIYQPSDLWIGQAKNQFPNVACAKDGYAIMKGEQYPIKPHGFLKLMELDATPIAENEISFSLKSNDETRALYPYEFEVTIHFVITGNQICQTYHVDNHDPETMYFGISCHTGFNTATGSYVDFGNNTDLMEILRPNRVQLSGEEVPFRMPDHKMPVSAKSMNGGAHILRNFSDKHVTLVNPTLHTAVDFTFAGFPYMTLWNIGETDEFMCMMPWHALPDYEDTNHIFAEKKGNITLPVGERFTIGQQFVFKQL